MSRLPTAAASALALMLAACGGADEDDIGVTDEMTTDRDSALAQGPDSGERMDLDEEDMDRPDGGLTEALDSDVAGDLLTVAERDGRFTTLLAAIDAAGLGEELRRGTYTLFAPTDDAFEALGLDATGQLLLPENRDQLVTILQYHVLDRVVTSGGIDGSVEAPTLAGDGLLVERVGERVQVGGAAVVTDADLTASNGVVHVIDTVLIPPAE